MSESRLPPSQPSRPSEQLDLLLRLYREIGITAVAAALEVGPAAPRQRRISAQKLLDKRPSAHLAA